jgi:glycosyltransferase involved in cell wall biosynthesis
LRFLFLAVHAPDRAPGQRFRFEQYLPALRERGIKCDYSGLLDGKDAGVLYSHGRVAAKALLTVRCFLRRLSQLPSLGHYDLVFVQREAFFAGGPVMERVAKARGAKLVFDFDDAIWLTPPSPLSRRFSWLRNPGKVQRIIAMADLVIAGNRYLADYARRENDRVTIVPTTIDTDRYVVRDPIPRGDVCVGWSGSFSTVAHFRLVLPALRRLRRRFGDRVRFKVIGDAAFRDEELGIVGVPWRADTEVDDLREIDVGLMPLPDDEWARGKCGLKALQYMALGIPAVMSPVGVNREIVRHGENGFLAETDDDWTATLASLVESPERRALAGAAGRRTVEEGYSVRAWRDAYCRHLTDVAAGARAAS